MNKVTAVIGANYGDEGKGAVTNFLARDLKASAVIRFNGGSQAGHTVRTSAGKRHIFSSYGSGTFYNIPTFIANTCLYNPKDAYSEWKNLSTKIQNVPSLYVDRDTLVVTEWDVALNQFLERGRGPERHGSCGKGIGETMLRKITPKAPKLYAGDILDPSKTYSFMRDMREWFKARLKEELQKDSFKYLTEQEQHTLRHLLMYPTILGMEVMTMPGYVVNAKIIPFQTAFSTENFGKNYVAEGAQGLLLDEDDLDHQPHVTWSKTGITNVVKFCKEHNLELSEVVYVTRPYLTRHGAGPMLAGHEVSPEFVLWDKCETNVPNEYQGTLRYGDLDWGKLFERIAKDLQNKQDFNPKVKLAVTCSDQIFSLEEYRFLMSGQGATDRYVKPEDAVATIIAKSPFEVIFVDGRVG